MKKKLLIAVIILSVLVPATLSAKLFDLSLGPNVQFTPNFAEITGGEDMGGLFSDINNYTFGADLRLKILLAEVDLVSTFGKKTEDVEGTATDFTEISILAAGGVSFDLFGITRLGIGLGPRFSVLIDENGNNKVMSGGNPVDVDNLGEAFLESPLALRATADFKLGKLWLGASYTLDTDYRFNNAAEFDKLFSADWDTGRFGVSLLFSLF